MPLFPPYRRFRVSSIKTAHQIIHKRNSRLIPKIYKIQLERNNYRKQLIETTKIANACIQDLLFHSTLSGVLAGLFVVCLNASFYTK